MTRLYKLSKDDPVEVRIGKLANENMIQSWVEQRPDLLGLELLIIGREVVAPDRGRVDLLGIDRSFPARRRSGERLRLRPYFPSEVARLFAFAGRSCS
jgi:hypothetical protein